jgi:hypothetical protein
MSPASTAGHSYKNKDFVGVEPMPQYAQHHQPHPEHDNVFLGLQPIMGVPQQQQTALHHSYPTNRERSNPVSEDDDQTEPSSSTNTGENQNNNGYTRSDAGATSTFGKLIQSATKVREMVCCICSSSSRRINL